MVIIWDISRTPGSDFSEFSKQVESGAATGGENIALYLRSGPWIWAVWGDLTTAVGRSPQTAQILGSAIVSHRKKSDFQNSESKLKHLHRPGIEPRTSGFLFSARALCLGVERACLTNFKLHLNYICRLGVRAYILQPDPVGHLLTRDSSAGRAGDCSW